MSGRVLRNPLARFGAGMAISGVFLLMTLTRIDVAVLVRAWSGVTLSAMGVVVLISLIEVGIRALRWRKLLRPLADPGYPLAYGMLSIGHLANAVLPARLGDLARAILAGSRLQISRTSVLGTVAVERVADSGLLVIAAGVGAAVGFHSLDGSLTTMAALVGAGAVGLLLAVIALRTPPISRSRVGRLAISLARRFAAGATALRSPAQVAQLLLLTISSFGLAVLLLIVAAAAVGLELPLWQAAIIMAFLTLSTAIPAGPASLGTYEFVGMGVMVSMGHPAEASLLAVAIVHGVAVVTPATVGLFSLWAMGIQPLASRFGTRSGDVVP